MYVLFPSSYLNGRKIDEAFQKEYDAVLDTGGCPVLFNQRIWDEKELLILDTQINNERPVLYRGWMMKPEQYAVFYEKLKQKDITLITLPEQYQIMHQFPNIYNQVKEDTPKIMTFPLHSHLDVEKIKKKLSIFLIKDFVKSAKNTDFPAYFDTNMTQAEFDRWMNRFYEIRGSLLTGGIVAKEFVNLKKYNSYSNEYRVFYLNNEPISISRNSLQPTYTPSVPTELVNKYCNLPSPFYTVDFAEKENGEWIIIETGDGGVSGLSEGQNYDSFFRAMNIVLKQNADIKKEQKYNKIVADINELEV